MFQSQQTIQVFPQEKTLFNVDLGNSQESLVVTTACLDKNVPAMYDLIRQFMLETNWDNEQKLNSLIKNSASGVVNSIASAGSRFAALYAASKHTPSKAASEVAGGMTQIRMLSQMARWEEYTELIAILKVSSTQVV
jgi:Zn-dependent M16 (insulinase) family peptidase